MITLYITAISLGFIHTILGPDHYAPFIALSKARDWTANKTFWITFVCGLGHILSSVILGFIGISFGLAVNKLEIFEIFREYMIDRIYLDLTTETNDMRIYGKLQEACQAAADEYISLACG